MKKNKRQAIIKRIVNENQINSQEELIELLREENITVTQSTISRDIKELNIVKCNDRKGNIGYRILNNSALGLIKHTEEDRLVNALLETGVSLAQIEFTNLLTVLPGNGQVIGVLLDSIRQTHTEIIGCVAGDDTILILSKNTEDATKINKMLGAYIYYQNN